MMYYDMICQQSSIDGNPEAELTPRPAVVWHLHHFAIVRIRHGVDPSDLSRLANAP